MLKFANEEVRLAFHSLPLTMQKEWTDLSADMLRQTNQVITFTQIGTWPPDGELEINIRINKQADIETVVDNLPGAN